MKKSTLEWKVGLFVLVGLILLGALLLQFSKGLTLFHPTYDILLRAPTAGSLKPRAQILMSGVQVGAISDIALAPDGKYVTITLRLFSQHKVYKDARFAIEQSGFLGDQYVAILPASNEGPTYANNEVAQAEAPFNMQELARSASGFIQRIDETAHRFNDMVLDVRQYLLNQQTLTNLSVTAANLRRASEAAVQSVNSLDALVASNAPAVARSGSNLVAFAEELQNAGGRINALLATNTPTITQAVGNVEDATAILKSAMQDVQAGKGLAGGLLRNEQILQDMEQITRNLSVTTSNLNRLGLWGILWEHKPRRTSESPSPVQPISSPKNPYSTR